MKSMLHCNMTYPMSLQLGLDDLLADLHHARRRGDLGRLALIAYCDVRRWARQAAEGDIARQSVAMFTDKPHASREAFLYKVDRLMHDLKQVQQRMHSAPPSPPATARRPVYQPPELRGGA